MKRTGRYSFAGILIITGLFLLTGCSSFINQYRASVDNVPLWILETPSSTIQSIYYTGIGVSESEIYRDAEISAAEMILKKVSTFLNMPISEEQQDEFLTTRSIVELGLKVVDRFSRSGPDGLSLYLLAEADRRIFSELAREGLETVRSAVQLFEQPFRQAETAYNRKNDFKALEYYFTSAKLAVHSPYDVGQEYYRESVQRILDILERFTLSVFSSDSGEGSITLELSRGANLFASKISLVPFTVSFPVKDSEGKSRLSALSVTSSSNGRISFSTDHPGFRGSGTITFSLAIDDLLGELSDAVGPDDPNIEAIRRAAAAVRYEFPFTRVSKIAGDTIALSLLEYNENGRLLQIHPGLTRITEVIEAEGLQVYSILIDPFNITTLSDDYSDDAVRRLLAESFSDLSAVSVLGSAGVSSSAKSGKGFVVTVKGDVSLRNLKTGGLLGESGVIVANGTGSTLEEARTAALYRFGEISGSFILGLLF